MSEYNNYNGTTPPPFSRTQTAAPNLVTATLKRVYLKMALALIVSGLTALFVASSPAMRGFFFGNRIAMWVMFGIEIVLVLAISGAINKMSAIVASLLFYLFAIVNGLTLTPILLFYTDTSIAKTFFITAGTFGAMSVYGLFTSRDLSRIGSILFMALIGLIIASVVNIFLPGNNPTFEWIISIAGVVIFVGLTAWDTQTIKNMAIQTPYSSASKLATLGALSLYLDFINLFLYLLRIFGNRD